MSRNTVSQKALSILLCFTMILSVFGVDTAGAFAAVNDSGAMRNGAPVTLSLDSGNILITDSGYSVGGGAITSYTGPYRIIGGNGSSTVTVQSGTQDITLQDVHARPAHGAAFEIESGAEAYITLAGSNSLDTSGSTSSRAGLAVNDGGTVRIFGSGSLTAAGGDNSAGIGGNNGQSCGTVEISGGTVTATGGSGGAGIGGGAGGSGGTITVSGGTITATGGFEGAGIGGGAGGYCGGTITVSGGTITTTGGSDGAGIGGGYDGSGGTTTVSGGTVTATGGGDGAGIGGGVGIGGSVGGSGGTVTISGAETQVTAKGGDGKDIGSGNGGTDGGSLVVSDGATVAMLNSNPSHNTNAKNPDTHSAPPKYVDCFIISGNTEKKYDRNGTGTSVTMLIATLTAQPATNGAVALTANAMNGSTPVTDGTFTFAYSDAKDSGTITDNVTIQSDGTASCTWTPPTDGLTVITAKYKALGFDALKAVFYYDPDAIDLSATGSDGFGYTYGSNTFTINQNGAYVFTGSTIGGAANKIAVRAGVSADITLCDASIDVHGTDNACAFSIAAGAKVNLTLEGQNTLKSGDFCAGLQVPGDASASTDTTKNASLTVTDASTGSLNATGGCNSVGIGGCNNILSNSPNSSGGNITINGGTVIANGIGGGAGGAGGTITISGGTVTATGGGGGAGIGGGYYGGSGGTITISGGTVTANGGGGGAGIGGGYHGSGGTITISGGTITATGGFEGAGIGGGYRGTGGTVTISGADTQVTAKGQGGGKDIGSGNGGAGGGGTGGGSLTVGGGSTVDGPAVELLSAGTNAANPDGSRPQFMNCVIHGAGAKDASGNDLSGCYDANGKIRLSISMHTPASAKIGEPVTLNASVTKYNPDVQKYQFNPVSLPGTVQFTGSGTSLGSPAGVTKGTAQISWTPANGNKVSLKAAYVPAADDRYAPAESAAIDYTPGKITPVIGTTPTASPVKAGEKLSESKLTGGTATANGKQIPGTFAWAHPDTAVTGSGKYEAIFMPTDTATYNTVGGILVAVTVAAAPSSGSHSSSTSAPSLPSSLTDVPTHITVDLSGVTFPSWVTGISLSVTPETASGAPTGTTGGAADPQGAAACSLALSDAALNVIGTPLLFNIRLLDRSGNPVSFTGTVTVRIPLPAGLRGTPRVFRYESDGTLTDMNAAVENGFLVFQTSHFSYYVIAGTGDSITLDTKDYSMPICGSYQIGVKLTGGKAAAVKFHSTNDKVATVAKLKNGNYQVTGNGPGTAYIMFDVYDNKNKLLTHASVRVDVKTGIRPRGDSTRQIGVF